MMRDAEAHAEEDKRRREEAEVRNQAETLVYQTEKFVKENDEKLPADVKDERQRRARRGAGGAQGHRHRGDQVRDGEAGHRVADDGLGAVPAARRRGCAPGDAGAGPAGARRRPGRRRGGRRDRRRGRRTGSDRRTTATSAPRTAPTASGSWCATGAGSTRRPARCATPAGADAAPAGAGRRTCRSADLGRRRTGRGRRARRPARRAHRRPAAASAPSTPTTGAGSTATARRCSSARRLQFVAELLTVLDDIERAERARRPDRRVQGGGRQAGRRGAEARPRAVRARGRAVRPVGARGRAARARPTVAGPDRHRVAAVLRRGYRIADRVLRPAMVAVDRPRRRRHGRATGAASTPVRRDRDPAETALSERREGGGVTQRDWIEKDFYRELGVSSERVGGRDQEGVPEARPRAAPGRQPG